MATSFDKSGFSFCEGAVQEQYGNEAVATGPTDRCSLTDERGQPVAEDEDEEIATGKNTCPDWYTCGADCVTESSSDRARFPWEQSIPSVNR